VLHELSLLTALDFLNDPGYRIQVGRRASYEGLDNGDNSFQLLGAIHINNIESI
jgi:hypothetical protein